MNSSKPPFDPEAARQKVLEIAADPENVLSASLPRIGKIVAGIARRSGLLPQQAEDLESEARLRLIENDYARLRAYEGRSSFETYLLTMIHRLAQDLRDKELGSWEPSAEARRIGPRAVALETLWQRDGRPLDECEGVLRSRFPELTRAEIEWIAARLPTRSLRRRGFVGDEELEAKPADLSPPDLRLEEREELLGKREILSALCQELAELGPEDRLLVRLRTESGLKVSEIARHCAQSLGLPQKTLYTRLDKIYAGLRRRLFERGFHAESVNSALHLGGRDVEEVS